MSTPLNPPRPFYLLHPGCASRLIARQFDWTPDRPPDGPYAPGCLRVGDREWSGIGGHQSDLLKVLWGKDLNAGPVAEPQFARDVAPRVYASPRISLETKLKRLSGLCRDLNDKLEREGIPLVVETEGRKSNWRLRLIRTPTG